MLDNCEHMVAACAELAGRILSAAAGVRILATSREALTVPGESIFAVQPLATPHPVTAEDGRSAAASTLEQFAAVRLFIDRALAVRADFAVTNDNAPAVAGICHRLDGIPLAIELAAARVKMLTAGEIHGRLADRFKLLTGGSRTVPTRQQTLVAAIDWSHDLLEPLEQELFRRASVFRGGWTIQAAEDVCSGDGIASTAVLDLMARLVDKSLVIADDEGQETRYRFLETVRAYAQDKLAGSEQLDEIRDRHLVWSVTMAEQAAPELLSGDAPDWIARLEREADNVRAALAWSARADDPARLDRGVRLTLAAWEWMANLHGAREMTPWLEVAFAAPTMANQPELLARCTHACGQAHSMAGDLSQARSYYEEAIAMFTALGMAVESARAMHDLAGNLMVHAAEHDAGVRLLQRSLTLKRQVAAPWDLAITINVYGEAARAQGDFETAIAAYEEAIALTQGEAGGANAMMWPLHNLGLATLRSGDTARAASCLTQALRIARTHRFRYGIAACIAGMADVATSVDDHDRAARLFGAADALLAAIGATALDPLDQADRELFEAITRARIAPGTWESAYRAGWAMSLDQAVAYALSVVNGAHD